MVESGGDIRSISAVTLLVRDMRRAVAFYLALGFPLARGGATAPFTTFRVGGGFLNLVSTPDADARTGWGRVIFHVDDVDVLYDRVRDAGFEPETAPRDAEWGERYFHVRDPDGHEISLARPLEPRA